MHNLKYHKKLTEYKTNKNFNVFTYTNTNQYSDNFQVNSPKMKVYVMFFFIERLL